MRYALLLAVLLLGGCRHNPLALDGVMRVTPTSQHYEIWQEVEECIAPTQSRLEFDEIQWYVVMNGEDYIESSACPVTGCGGLFRMWEKAIYLDDEYERHDLVIGHEIMHAMIGDGDHCSPLWDQCGVRGVMECTPTTGRAD